MSTFYKYKISNFNFPKKKTFYMYKSMFKYYSHQLMFKSKESKYI